MKPSKTILVILLHLVVVYLTRKWAILGGIWGYSAIFYGGFAILSRKNRGGEAHKAAAYILGLEIVIRLTQSQAYLVYEFGKYGVILMLLTGLIVETKKVRFYIPIIVYFIVMLPAIAFTQASVIGDPLRQVVSGLMSGPFCLCISVIYFFKRQLDADGFKDIVYWFNIPLICASFLIIIHLVGIENLRLTTSSNPALSGGFGPNQVSTILCGGGLLIFVACLLGKPIYGSRFVDLVLAFTLLSFGFLTFSRGGTISALASLLVGMFISQLKVSSSVRIKLAALSLVISFVVFQSWVLVNHYTDGYLSKRYMKGIVNTEKVTFTRRTDIIHKEWIVFLQNPILGVGAGMSSVWRLQGDGESIVYQPSGRIASHNEFTRMLADHGIFGALSLFILLISPLMFFLRLKNAHNQVITVTCVSYAFLTLAHSATRLALPSFFYGMAFMYYMSTRHRAEKESQHTSDTSRVLSLRGKRKRATLSNSG